MRASKPPKPSSPKCDFCKEEAEFLYHIDKSMGCINCFHASRGNDAFHLLHFPISRFQKSREKLFK